MSGAGMRGKRLPFIASARAPRELVDIRVCGLNAPRMASRGLIGTAGEYAVASELQRRGWIATLTGHNSPDIDILARHSEPPHRQIAIQVKSVSPGSRAFPLKTAHEGVTDDSHLWYVFVRFHDDLRLRPTYYIASWNEVAAVLREKRIGAERQGKVVRPGRRNFLTEWLEDSVHLDAWRRLSEPAPTWRHASSALPRFTWVEGRVDQNEAHLRLEHDGCKRIVAVVGPPSGPGVHRRVPG